MASFFIFSLLFLFLFLFLLNFNTTVTSAIEINFTTFNIAPNPNPSPSPPPPLPSLSVIARPTLAHLQETPQQLQFNSIIDSIVGAGDFSNWANLLSQADPSIFPLTATLFVPEDGAFLAGESTSPATSFDPLLIPYHIVPRRFTFTELRQFPNGARLPTLLPGKILLITNNSAGNFSVNGALLTHPDLFQSSVVSVHGIGTVLDYNTFGDDLSSPENFLDRNPSPGNMLGEVLSPPLPEFEQDRRRPVVGSPKNVASSAARILQIDWALILGMFAVILLLLWEALTTVLPNVYFLLLSWITCSIFIVEAYF